VPFSFNTNKYHKVLNVPCIFMKFICLVYEIYIQVGGDLRSCRCSIPLIQNFPEPDIYYNRGSVQVIGI
jgi:hypothetical protein